MSRTLIIIEPTAHPMTLIRPLITSALQLAPRCDICLLGSASESIYQQLHHDNIGVCWTIESANDNATCEDTLATISPLIPEYDTIITAASSFGRSLIPRLAGTLMIAPVTDIISIESPLVFKRPIYAGNAIETVESHQKKNLLTVRLSSFQDAKMQGKQPEKRTCAFKRANLTEYISKEESDQSRPELISADVVVAGGAGLGSKEKFTLIEKLADHMGAAIGASRAAVDAGYVPNDYQVGQTGKIIAPKVYIAIGISGAIQHLAGMKDSHLIVAINNDSDAPIFKIADIGYHGDLFDALDRMLSAEKK